MAYLGFNTISYTSHSNGEGAMGLIVNYLMEVNSNTWDVVKVRSLFCPRLTTEILKIKLSSQP